MGIGKVRFSFASYRMTFTSSLAYRLTFPDTLTS
jgi:hypothetical protein